MRILIGGFHHESDTFNPIITSKEEILLRRGDELFSQQREDALGGIVKALKESDVQIIPSLHARAVPNGEWDKEYYLSLKDEFLSCLKNSLPLDGICLALHGSMRVHGIGEAEGDLLEAIREICPDVPIVSSLDMHATMTIRMLANSDGFAGYKCAPHTDAFETGYSAASLLLYILNEGEVPFMSAYHIPFLVAGEQSETSVEPMKSIMDYVRECERREGILSASLLMGFPWADVYENGVTSLVVAKDKKLADKASFDIASFLWGKRKEFCFYNETYEMEASLDHVKCYLNEGASPIVLSDSGDNPTAGSSQDVTNYLKLILRDEELSNLVPPLVYQAFYDPEVCRKAFLAGVGGYISAPLGAAFDKETSTPIQLMDAKVLSLYSSWEGVSGSDLALIDVNGVLVVVTSCHVGCYEPSMMRVLGLTPEKMKVIVVKLGYLEPEIRSIAEKSMLVLSDGSTNEIFSRLPYKNLRRPIFPFDDDSELKIEKLY